MNAVVVARETLNAELSEVVKRNGVTAVKNVKNVNMVEAKLSGDKNIAIYDWTGAMEEDMNAVKELVKIDEKYNLKVLLLVDEGIKDAIRLLVKYENVKYIFKPITKERLQIGLRMLLAEKKQPPDINIEYINPFIEAAKSIFKQMAFTDIEKKGVNVDRGLTVRGDLSGVMALSGQASGFVIISMGTDTAFELVKKMTMGNVQENESEIIEGGVMEMINVISGQAQSMFNQNKYHFDFTTPTMIKGKGHSINHGVTVNSIVVRFETKEGKEIFLQVCLKHAGTSEK